LNDTLQLEIYNYEKENAKVQETMIEEKLEAKDEKETLKIV